MKEKVIEKITCIMEPQGAYLNHFEPDDGTALLILCCWTFQSFLEI